MSAQDSATESTAEDIEDAVPEERKHLSFGDEDQDIIDVMDEMDEQVERLRSDD